VTRLNREIDKLIFMPDLTELIGITSDEEKTIQISALGGFLREKPKSFQELIIGVSFEREIEPLRSPDTILLILKPV
jgi:hypothetical protein